MSLPTVMVLIAPVFRSKLPASEQLSVAQLVRDLNGTGRSAREAASIDDIIGAIGAVIQHFILFLKDAGYSSAMASRFFTALLVASLGCRVLVGYVSDRFRKKDVMAIFYGALSISILLLNFVHSPAAVWAFVMVFGFSMGADYMLIPLVAAECVDFLSRGDP